MESKKTRLFLFITSLVLLGIGYVSAYPERFGICASEQWSCISDYSYSFGQPILIGSFFLVPVLFSLLFFSKEISNTWKKFAMGYIPLAIIFVGFQPVFCSSLICTDKKSASWAAGIGFLVISLLIILYKKIRISSKV